MKKYIAFFFIAFLATTASSGQNTKKEINTANAVMVYSEEYEAIVYKSESQANGSEILIESLPGYGVDPIPVEVFQDKNGSYTFKKHPSLIVPEYYNVIITDSLTGQSFDLKNSDSYTFDVTKATPDRFMLYMYKSKMNLTAMR
jgi:hypothetical protein